MDTGAVFKKLKGAQEIMSMDKKKIIGISAAIVGAVFVGMSILAKKKKPSSIYEDNKEQKNPFEGKKVILIKDDSDEENADGVKGHLEAAGNSEYRPGFYEKYIKRAIDVILSFGGLVMLSPVFAVIALAIKLEDPGPVLFTQKRVGQNKRYFKLHKFRSMKMSTPHDVPTHQLENPEQYITKVGRFLRAHSLDEYDIIGQTRKSLENRGFREVSPMIFFDNHTRFGWYSCDMRIATV